MFYFSLSSKSHGAKWSKREKTRPTNKLQLWMSLIQGDHKKQVPSWICNHILEPVFVITLYMQTTGWPQKTGPVMNMQPYIGACFLWSPCIRLDDTGKYMNRNIIHSDRNVGKWKYWILSKDVERPKLANRAFCQTIRIRNSLSLRKCVIETPWH